MVGDRTPQERHYNTHRHYSTHREGPVSRGLGAGEVLWGQ